MPLDAERIKAILAQPKKKSRSKKGPDTNVRDFQTWFALAPKTRDELGTIELRCDNPECVDPRPPRISALGEEIKHQFVVEVGEVKMCRYCFLDGYMLNDPEQLELS